MKRRRNRRRTRRRKSNDIGIYRKLEWTHIGRRIQVELEGKMRDRCDHNSLYTCIKISENKLNSNCGL